MSRVSRKVFSYSVLCCLTLLHITRSADVWGKFKLEILDASSTKPDEIKVFLGLVDYSLFD